MLNSNGNIQCMVSLTFPFAVLLIQEALKIQERPEIGSHVFIVESNRTVTRVIVAAKRGDFYTLRFLNSGAIKLRQNRIFSSREDAEKKIPEKVEEKRRLSSPYDYGIWLEGEAMKDEIHVACQCCKNKRLFDAYPNTEGIIKIKCPICRGVIVVSFHYKKIRTERIATQ